MARIQLSRKKGWKLPDGAVSVARPTIWGNPFTVRDCLDAGYAFTRDEARHMCVSAFEDWLVAGEFSQWWHDQAVPQWFTIRSRLHELDGKTLACWCRLDQPCHADVLIKYAPMASTQWRLT